MRCANRLGLVFLFGLLTSAHALSQTVPCAKDERVRELPTLQFSVDPEQPRVQRSQFVQNDMSGWGEAEFTGDQLRFNNLAPGLGLSFDIVFVRVEVIDDRGIVLEQFSSSIPSAQECFLLSIFPGGSTTYFDLSEKLKGLQDPHRVRVRVWVPN